MQRLQSLVLGIGLEELINCTLVQEGVRNAMLIQPADYNEATSSDKTTKAKLMAIRRAFPDLILNDIGGETLISRKVYTRENIKRNSDMGAILGYPCAAAFDNLNSHKEVTYMISINVNLKPGYNRKYVQILAYVCKDDSSFAGSKLFAERCETVLKKSPVLSPVIVGVEAILRKHMPVAYLINKLALNEKLSPEEGAEIKNHIWNLGLPESQVAGYDYKYDNPLHRGILIGLLTICDNNPMEPFFPLQHRKESKEIDLINGKWEKELIRVFKLTEKASGGKRRTVRSKGLNASL